MGSFYHRSTSSSPNALKVTGKRLCEHDQALELRDDDKKRLLGKGAGAWRSGLIGCGRTDGRGQKLSHGFMVYDGLSGCIRCIMFVVLFAFELCEFHVHLNRSSSMKSITPYGRIDPRILTIL